MKRRPQTRLVVGISILLILALSSCATSYGPLGPTGGYYDKKLGNDTYDVAFKGNPLVSEAQIRDLLLIRCAMITMEHGHASFVVWADSSFSDVKTNRATREQPWKEGSSSINQATVNPDVSVDTEQVWFTARYIIQTFPAGSLEHAHAQLIAQQVLDDRRHLLK